MSRRTLKVAEAIRETVSTAVLFELRDPRVRNVTVIRAEVSPDLRHAKVYVSVMGDEKGQSLSLHGLESARGFLQKKVADRLQTRYTPQLAFVLDESVKKSVEASRLIREALAEDEDGRPAADGPPADAPQENSPEEEEDGSP
ncbi:MAG: 30S ribosome-binding factor RbfA [Planctomycetales bacterium]